MAASKKRLEMQREELVSRLQGMMRSHWVEALKLLTNPGQIENMFVPPPLWEASKISCHLEDTSSSDTHLPGAQAVVLNLSRERENERETHSHSDVLNYRHSFTPLEPVLDHTHLTAISDCSALWVRPVISEEEGNSTERKMKERKPSQSRNNQSHAFTETCTNPSSSSDRADQRWHFCSTVHVVSPEKAPPTKEEALPSI
ncbi:putative centrobin-like [Triplophysa rosa]|uniref:Centrobin-like n=2 Tax=Triplophysa rosa TaxID=992332 RepID=A0A9W7WD73_TRIRA|nr:putative centrobin-like [Triplophysa rosa]